MRTALLLLLLLAVAAVPGSLVPQRSSDPNGVTQYFRDNPDLAPILDNLQMFDVFTSAWFSAIYLLLFASLVGCVIPRTRHHLKALGQKPPKTPLRLNRMAGFIRKEHHGAETDARGAAGAAEQLLRKSGYRTVMFDEPATRGRPGAYSVSAERGYLRETGNLLFHIALLGVLVAVGVGGGFGFTGQRVVVEGQTMVNSLVSYDSFNPGRFFNDSSLKPFTLSVDTFDVTYQSDPNKGAYGQALDFDVKTTTRLPGEEPQSNRIKVNEPLSIGGTNVYLLGNGYAPTITVRDPSGRAVYREIIPFLPQDTNLTSTGIIKVPDGLADQLGMIGFFYPTPFELGTGALTSAYPDLKSPVLELRAYRGDLGINDGTPRSVYTLDTDGMTQIAGGKSGTDALRLGLGETVELPDGLGTISLDEVNRFASLDVHRDPAQGWVLLFAVLATAGMFAALLIPRRRVWVRATDGEGNTLQLEYAGLARGEDPQLAQAVADVARRHEAALDLEAPLDLEASPDFTSQRSTSSRTDVNSSP